MTTVQNGSGFKHTLWWLSLNSAQIHDSAYRKHRISTCGSREFSDYVKCISRVCRDGVVCYAVYIVMHDSSTHLCVGSTLDILLFAINLMCACVLHVVRHSSLTQLAQKFGDCPASGKQSHEIWSELGFTALDHSRLKSISFSLYIFVSSSKRYFNGEGSRVSKDEERAGWARGI